MYDEQNNPYHNLPTVTTTEQLEGFGMPDPPTRDNVRDRLNFVTPGRPDTLRVNGVGGLVTDGPFFDDRYAAALHPCS